MTHTRTSILKWSTIRRYGCMLALCGLLMSGGCKKFLDVVPDNVATVDNAFSVREEAEKYLLTCYSYLPDVADYASNPAFMAGDEYWMDPEFQNINTDGLQVAMGFQNATSPYLSNWEDMFKALRDCNIFLANIEAVPDMKTAERNRWTGEALFLKAYYHWCLFRRYGPIPIIDENLPISSSVEDVKVKRQSVDSVVNYISDVLTKAAALLPDKITNRQEELGRVTRPIALSIKAKVLVTGASPLFNGNTDFASLKNKGEETPLFDPEYQTTKWEKAAAACKEAIDACAEQGISLFEFADPFTVLSDTLSTQMSIRNAFAQEWNSELIWGATYSRGDSYLQRLAMPRLDPAYPENETNIGQLAPTLKMAELFYSVHGVPINEDVTWDYADRYELKTVDADAVELLIPNYPTAALNIDREPRFYADLAFDGNMWYMYNGLWPVQAKFGQAQAQKNRDGFSMTGYFVKKLVNWHYVIKANYQISAEEYPWPIMRLADLYLLYAEVLNEAEGPTTEAYDYLNQVRARAGLNTVQESWTNYSSNPGKYTTQEGLRSIIHQERMIELAFEGSRFWDLRRWKTAVDELNKPIRGWDIVQSDADLYYRPKVLYQQSFQPKDYLWPIRQYDVLVNPNLVQNPGW